MTAQDEQNRDDELHQLVHDAKHCLHVIGIGAALLKGARNDDRRFAETCESLDNERKKAAQLVSQFLRVAREKAE